MAGAGSQAPVATRRASRPSGRTRQEAARGATPPPQIREPSLRAHEEVVEEQQDEGHGRRLLLGRERQQEEGERADGMPA